MESQRIRRFMPTLATGAVFLVAAVLGASAHAQSTLASTLNVYAFPQDGQNAEQQSKDEAACYQWASDNTGSDPFAASKQQEVAQQEAQQSQEQAAKAAQGAGGRGLIGGAAAGAVIGELANDDASKGAAYGAAAGAIISRRRAAASQQHAQAEGQQQVQVASAASAEQIGNFKKAFSVCLEGKKYLVRY